MPTIYEDAWVAHFTAHNEVGVSLDVKAKNVAETYSEDAVLKEYNYKTQEERVYRGIDEICKFFKWHLEKISVNGEIADTFRTYPNNKDEDVVLDGSSLFIKWGVKTDKIHYEKSADSFFLKEVSDGTAKIAYHFQHVYY
eukprot:jgi/Psemu1/311210/fgenesh1_kg.740_\